MSPIVEKKPDMVALLSVAGLTDGQSASGSNFALLEVGGRPLLAWQMLALRSAGLDVFLIEVDSVPGVLLDLADSFRRSGMRVEFIRNISDLWPFLEPDTKLAVQAEAHYFSASTISELGKPTAPFVATIDGRDENAAFERIDLNTRWAGFALLDASTALAMDELPEGWSITSSLLRQAIRGGTRLRAIPQSKLQRGDVLRVATQHDAAALGNSILSDRADSAPGWIEKHVFGTIAKALAPSIWRAGSRASLLPFTGPVFAGISLGCGLSGWSLASLASALLALLAKQIFDVVHGTNSDEHRGNWRNFLLWGLLVTASIAVAWAERGYMADSTSFMAIVVALAFIARKIPLRRWSTGLLKSPALVTVGLLTAMSFSQFAQGAKAIVFIQLALLLIDQYLPRNNGKKSNQA